MSAASQGRPTVHAIWCDDIRQEVGNKPSFMGVYTGALLVPELPITLPKLCVWVTLTAPLGMELGEVSAEVTLDDGAPLWRAPPFSPEAHPTAGEAGPTALAWQQQFMLAVMLAPLVLPQDARGLVASVTVAGKRFSAAPLAVVATPNPSAAPGPIS